MPETATSPVRLTVQARDPAQTVRLLLASFHRTVSAPSAALGRQRQSPGRARDMGKSSCVLPSCGKQGQAGATPAARTSPKGESA